MIKNELYISFLLLFLSYTVSAQCGERVDTQYQTPQSAVDSIRMLTDDGHSFLIITDMNRMGRYNQRKIAETFGDIAEACDAEFVIVTGDIFHYLGVQSVSDPLFRYAFEDMYPHPELQIPWHVIPGNHEYKGNVQALVDYSLISRRWEMPARYYTATMEDDAVGVDLFLLDTPPLIDKYRNSDTYPQAREQDRDAQLEWLKDKLHHSTAKYKLVLGHHPIYADTPKDPSERADMQKYVNPILVSNGVDIYFSGHIHNHQVIERPDSPILYITVSAASKTRKVKAIEGTKYCSSSAGFAVVTLKDGSLTVRLLDGNGHILHTEVVRK